LVWAVGRAPSGRRATTRCERACMIARVRGTAWASGFDQNKSPFSRDGRAVDYGFVQCEVLLLRGTRSLEEPSIWSRSMFPYQTSCLSSSDRRWIARVSNTQAFARRRTSVSALSVSPSCKLPDDSRRSTLESSLLHVTVPINFTVHQQLLRRHAQQRC